MVEPHSSNFRVITTKFLGVRIFRKFTVEIFVSRNRPGNEPGVGTIFIVLCCPRVSFIKIEQNEKILKEQCM